MKALIIILALVGVTFVGLLVYGGVRSDTPRQACAQVPDDPTDPDKWKSWCPPGLADATKGLQARFAPGLGLKKAALLRGQGVDVSFRVGPSDKKVRAAKIKLAGGDAAILTDGDDGKLCLCRPRGSQIDDRLLSDQCPASWMSKHLERAKPGEQRKCQKNDDAGVLPFHEVGGQVVLKAQPPAAVSIE